MLGLRPELAFAQLPGLQVFNLIRGGEGLGVEQRAPPLTQCCLVLASQVHLHLQVCDYLVLNNMGAPRFGDVHDSAPVERYARPASATTADTGNALGDFVLILLWVLDLSLLEFFI